MFAKCEVCGEGYKFMESEVVSYTVRKGVPEAVALNGRDPWSGVRIVCVDCIAFLSAEARIQHKTKRVGLCDARRVD